jgi:condensin complex subunit 1
MVAEYCDAQLPLFLTIMERSKNPIIRSNAVIALGDMVSPIKFISL